MMSAQPLYSEINLNKEPEAIAEVERGPAPFDNLSQDLVIDAIESLGFICDLRVFPLNSYENRVYQCGIEDKTPIIAKFYRPQRWSDEQILEEHEFSFAATDFEIPMISPMRLIVDGGSEPRSLFEYKGFRFSLYERKGGHAPELEDLDTLYTLGQHMGRLHALGAVKPFLHRPAMTVDTFALQSQSYILENNFIPPNLEEAYRAISTQLIAEISRQYLDDYYTPIRIHGDCHPGNILSRPDSLYIVDLDDARTGPAIQDIWMLLSGDRPQKSLQLSTILEGYEEFYEFNPKELKLIESLRAMRLIHYAAWLAKRWHDPAFPQAFPWFNTERYWAEHILELKEQMSEMAEAPLKLQDM